MKKIDWSGFISNMLSVVLGIFITFWIQGMIDRKAEIKEVNASLELVKDELIANKNDLHDVIGILSSEKTAAEYIIGCKSNFSKCDIDSLRTFNSYLNTEYFFTVTDDALELMKSSSLFQKMNDNRLALKIIKAYDYLGVNAQAFNTHEKYKTTVYNDANTDKTKKYAAYTSGTDLLKKFYSTAEADNMLRSMIEMSNSEFLQVGLPEIDATIAEIESRLK